MACSPMRLIANHQNILSSAVASSVRASRAINTRAVTRTGNGRVRVVGDYTGMDDATFDIEILNGGGTPRASTPTFAGVGSGTMTIQNVDAAATLQELTVSLVDMGTVTAAASLEINGVTLQDATPGASGNAIHLEVTPNLVKTARNMATIQAWNAGTAYQTDASWAGLGALPLANDEINPSTPRIIFGNDPTVYRPYYKTEEGQTCYYLSPSLERDIAEGLAVYDVTGGYTITVTEGATVEAYTATTFYDMLTALNASGIIEVAGVVANDRTPGGQAVIDVPLRTQAFVAKVSGVALENTSAATNAPTENVTVKCINADYIGQETWGVTGTSSGNLGTATTGTAFASSSALFTVPTINPEGQGSGRAKFKYEPVDRADGECTTCVEANPIALGINASALSLTWVYTLRPVAECPCPGSLGGLSSTCLGLTGDTDMSAVPVTIAARLIALQNWAQNLISQQADFQTTQNVAIARYDMDLIEGALSEYQTALIELEDAPAGLAEWDIKFAALQVEMAVLAGVLDIVPIVASASYLVGYKYVSQNGVIASVSAATLAGVSVSGVSVTANMAPILSNWPTTGTFSITGEGNGGADDAVVSMTVSTATDGDIYRPKSPSEVDQILRKYTAQMNHCRAVGGILPKSDASNLIGDGCWRDNGASYWWVETTGEYAPVFSNEKYYSSRKNMNGGYESTKEFGFGLGVGCDSCLKEGDKITFSIDSSDIKKPYNVGDEAIMTIHGGAPAYLTGGVDGNDTQTWSVSGSVSGGLPDYLLTSTPPSVTTASVTWTLAPGGIPFDLGDSFRVSIEAGQYRWRKAAGVWSANADIPTTGTPALADGLSLAFYPASAPSFAAGDTYLCTVQQPYAPRHALAPSRDYAWEWVGATATLTLQSATPQAIDMLAVGMMNLPVGATLAVAHSLDGTTWTSYTLASVGVLAVKPLPAEVVAQYIRVTVANATGGRIGWAWAGQGFSTEAAAKLDMRYQWTRSTGGGINPTALMLGLGRGTQATFEWLSQNEANSLASLITHAHSTDQPIIAVPHILHPDESTLCRVDVDDLTLTDYFDYQPNDAGRRILSATLPLQGWYNQA